MRVMYTHNELKRMTKERLVKLCIMYAERCGKIVREETLLKYDKEKVYDKCLKYRNEYTLFYKGER